MATLSKKKESDIRDGITHVLASLEIECELNGFYIGDFVDGIMSHMNATIELLNTVEFDDE